MSIPVKLVADAFLAEAAARGKPLNPYQLHKFLYLAQGNHLVTTGNALFDEEIYAWENGPVCDFIYRLFPKDPFPRYEPIPGTFEFPKIEAVYAASILTVLALCLSVHVDKVAKATHRPDTPWSITWDDRRGKNAVIEKSLILKKFEDDLTHIPMITLSHSNLLASQGVLFENEEEVAGFLGRHNGAEDIVTKLLQNATSILPKGTQFTLELYKDPEIVADELVLWARAEIYPENFGDLVRKAVRMTRETTPIREMAIAGGKISLDCDYRTLNRVAA